MMKKPIRLSRPKILYAGACLFLIMALIGQVHAGNPAADPRNTLRASEVVIEDKAEKYNLIYVSERPFRVSTSAVILDYNKEKIPLGSLRTPCKAKITYRLFGDNRYPMVQKIQVQ
jgi:hypothetical protein